MLSNRSIMQRIVQPLSCGAIAVCVTEGKGQKKKERASGEEEFIKEMDNGELAYAAPAVANNFAGENQGRLVRGRAACRHCSYNRDVAAVADAGSELGEGVRRHDEVGLEVKKEWNGKASVKEPLLPRWSSSALGGVRGGDEPRGKENRQRDDDHRFVSLPLPLADRGIGMGTGELGRGRGLCGGLEGRGGSVFFRVPIGACVSCRQVLMTAPGP